MFLWTLCGGFEERRFDGESECRSVDPSSMSEDSESRYYTQYGLL